MSTPVTLCAGLRLAAVVAATHPVAFDDGRVRPIEPEPLAVSSEGEVSLTILERPFEGSPIELRLSGHGVTIPDNRIGWGSVVDPQAEQPRLRARILAPSTPGKALVRARVLYMSCEEQRCRPRTASVLWELDVVER